MLTYPGTITLSERTLTFLARLLETHREQRRTWRKLSASEQALLVLAHLRNGDTYQRLSAGFGSGWPPPIAASGRRLRCWPRQGAA